MQTNFKRLTKPELDFLKDNCNFSDDEKTMIRNKLQVLASKVA